MDTATTNKPGAKALRAGVTLLVVAFLLVAAITLGVAGRGTGDNPLLLLAPVLGIAGLVLTVIGLVKRA